MALITVPADKVAAILSVARTKLRDEGTRFQQKFTGTGDPFSYELPARSIKAGTVVVTVDGDERTTITETTPNGITLDYQNGYLSFDEASEPAAGVPFWVEGQHYEWFSESQLQAYADIVIGNYIGTEGDRILTELESPVAVNAFGIAVLVEALWALLTEIARDIDVNTAETDIPANQRYRQVYQLLTAYQAELEGLEALLNIGLNRVQQFDLRRVSYLTGRYVPVYIPQEWGDTRAPVRIYPRIDTGALLLDDVQSENEVPLKVHRYEERTLFTLTVKVAGVAQDVSGDTFSAHIYNSANLQVATIDIAFVTTGTDGKIAGSISSTESDLAPGLYNWTLLWTNDDGTETIAFGPFTVET